MKHFPAILTILVCLSISGYAVWGSGVASNTQSNASQVQGSDPAGNSLGYPFAIVNATGTSIDCNLTGSAINQSVTQGTSPWIVGQDAGSNPWTVNGTVTANQGTPNAGGASSWPVAPSSILNILADGSTNTPIQAYDPGTGQYIYSVTLPYVTNGTTWDRQRSANGAAGTSGTGLVGSGLMIENGVGGNWFQVMSGPNADATTGIGIIACTNYIERTSDGLFFMPLNSSADANNQARVPLVTSGHWNGSSIDRDRTPAVFKTAATAAAGNTALWTPAAGKKFRLMRYMIEVTEQATQAAGGTINITLFDGAAGATGQVHDIYVPGAALGAAGDLYTSPWIDLGNGYLSAAANNVLNVNLSAALTAGTVRVICCGTEE